MTIASATGLAGAITGAITGAPAKINLTLHVTGQRNDGYHLLESLVVFADVNDRITARPSPDLSLTVSGPFSAGVPTDDTNLILRAARLLRLVRGVSAGAALHLEKCLPHAAGIGSGSSDAAATLRLLADMWKVPPLTAHDSGVLALGADVPVCINAPTPVLMGGIGDTLRAVPVLPPCALVLVNPRAPVATGAVFAAMKQKHNPGMDSVPAGLDFDGFADWLAAQRNDMQPAAESIAPPITTAMTALRRNPAVRFATMSGSGATCVGLVRDMGAARQVARAIQVGEMAWWVAPAELLN